ncbi:MAG: amino acid ABC transporter ATP-binding/permease protein [Coriobacteriales bacterium]|jgi:ATP-binding cassette subfamily C protein CydC|nr:amino acid ABC transporter ATP-binding/permease protein [Coriobacteriales bacterium]
MSAPTPVERTRQGAKRWIIPYFKQYRGSLAIALFLGILTFSFAAALMFTSGYLISKAAEAPDNIMVIFLPVALVRIFGVGKPILHYLERLLSHDWIFRMTSSLRLGLYTILEKDAIFFKQRYKTGDILGLLAEDIGHIQNLYLRSIFPTIVAWVLYVLVIIFLGCFSLWFALLMLLLLGCVVLLVPLVSVLVNGARQARRKTLKNTLYEQVTDNVLGVRDWIIAQRGSEYVQSYRTSEAGLRKVDAALFRSARNRDLVLQTLYALIVIALLVWAGTHFGGEYAGVANWIAAFVLGFFPLIDAFAPLSAAAIETNKYRDSIDRLGELPDAPDASLAGLKGPAPGAKEQFFEIFGSTGLNDEPETESERAPDHAFAISEATGETGHDCAISEAANAAAEGSLHVPSSSLVIQSNQLSFRYPDGVRNVLDKLDLTIQGGEKLAILGRSGSGKSTFAALLRGDLVPSEGSVTINGVAPSEMGDGISNYIGVIQQQTYLFNTTLAENLRVGNASATDEELWTALEQVGLDALAKRLPDGLETLVDEAGLRFSGGERHRIALARVLLKQVPIVLLDEPTVGLDPATEQALLNTFFSTMKDKTVIMITHHLQGVALMDKVIFIEDGTLTMCGSPEELEKNDPYFQRLQAFDKGM